MHTVIAAHAVHAVHADVQDHLHGWQRCLFAPHHKDIGASYLWVAFIILQGDRPLAMLIRAGCSRLSCNCCNPNCLSG